METLGENIDDPRERKTISRAVFMYEALEGVELDAYGNPDPEKLKNILKVWRAAGGVHYHREIPFEEYSDPDSDIMDDEINLAPLYKRMRAAEAGDQYERASVMSSAGRWNLFCKLINNYLFNDSKVHVLSWDPEVHKAFRSNNLERRLGAIALLQAQYQQLEQES
jgi:hypothetical protein